MRSLHFVPVLSLLTGCPEAGTGSTGEDTGGAGTTAGTGETPDPGATGDAGTTAPHATDTTNTPDTTTGDTTGTTDDASTTSSEGSDSSDAASGMTTAPLTTCGDGVIDGDESCDDGNLLPDDGCSPTCEQGPGAALAPVVPPLLPGENLRCMAIVDKQHLGGPAHGLTLGGVIDAFGAEGQFAAHVWQLPLPGGPVGWSYLDHAGPSGRLVHDAATAADGDVIVVGLRFNEQVLVDSGGPTWMARFSPAGELVWDVELDATTMAHELTLTPDGDAVLVGRNAGLASVYNAHRVRGSDGALLWTYSEPFLPEQDSDFADVAVDADDNVYIVGSRSDDAWPPEAQDRWIFVRALGPDGGERWQQDLQSPGEHKLRAATIVVTADEQVVVTGVEYEADDQPKTARFIALDLEGAPLWSHPWIPEGALHAYPAAALATPGGGMYLTGTIPPQGGSPRRFTARFDADGLALWANFSDGPGGRKLALDPDGLLHVLTRESVVPHLP